MICLLCVPSVRIYDIHTYTNWANKSAHLYGYLFTFQTMSNTLDNLLADESTYVEMIEEKQVFTLRFYLFSCPSSLIYLNMPVSKIMLLHKSDNNYHSVFSHKWTFVAYRVFFTIPGHCNNLCNSRSPFFHTFFSPLETISTSLWASIHHHFPVLSVFSHVSCQFVFVHIFSVVVDSSPSRPFMN